MDRRTDSLRETVSRPMRLHWPVLLCFGAAFGLAIFWFGIGAAVLVLPFSLLGLLLITDRRRPRCSMSRDGSDAPRRLRAAIDDAFRASRNTRGSFACIIVQLDGFGRHPDKADHAMSDHVGDLCLDCLAGATRREDALFALSPGRIAILLSPVARLERAAILAIADRLRAALAGVDPQNPGAPHLSACMGICRDDALTDRSGRAMLLALDDAVTRAAEDGPGSTRFHGEQTAP